MDRDEAATRSAALNREETGDRHWFPKQVADEKWEVVSSETVDLG